MGNPKDISGQRFGRLTAIKCIDKKDGDYIWELICDCGNAAQSSVTPLFNGSVKSCGCYRTDVIKASIEKLHYIDGTLIESIKSKKLRSDNTSGTRGVTLIKPTGKWRACITFKGQHYHLGVYPNLIDAIKARKDAEARIFGDFIKWFDGNINNSPRD